MYGKADLVLFIINIQSSTNVSTVRESMQNYAKVCKSTRKLLCMQKYTKVCESVQKYAKADLELFTFSGNVKEI